MTTHSSRYWIDRFSGNAEIQRLDWDIAPALTDTERRNIVRSLQAWQLGETSDGAHLLRAAVRYAAAVGDTEYPDAVRLFIKEEQKHGRNLGRYLDLIGEPRLERDWGDSLFRRVRYLNNSMELWTIAVITVESSAQIFYRALRDATGCELLRQICTEILIDEAAHITFQKERLHAIFGQQGSAARQFRCVAYPAFFRCTGVVVWLAHRRLFVSGGVPFRRYLATMGRKRRNLVSRSALLGATAETRDPALSPGAR